MQIDLELALVDASRDELVTLQSSIPKDFFVEDQTNRGWGLVIRTTLQLLDDLSDSVDSFLEPLSPLAKMIGDHEGILRVGIFYNTATCTMQIASCERLALFKLSLEISTYPSSDGEE